MAAAHPTRARPRRRRRPPLRAVLALAAVAVLVAAAVIVHGLLGRSNPYPPPSPSTLAGMSVPQRIVAIVDSQVGYRTDPADSYCNKYSAYWGAGTADCPGGESTEEWCADFAAWAWQLAGVPVTYGYDPGDVNGAAVSFYQWAVANGAWHPATGGYVPTPGSVAVYGLELGPHPSAAHVAVVTGTAPGQPGPEVVNGDGDRTGFSVVETGTDQVQVHAGRRTSALSGYVSPP